jgi:uncharacterized lipoprotein NlpE involved in copper resistance
MKKEEKPKNIDAFPCDNKSEGYRGMSLRDYFAAKAMEGFIATFGKTQNTSSVLELADDISEMSYGIADEMLKQREL